MYNSKDISIVQHMKEYCEDIRRTVNRFGNSFEVFSQDLDYRNSVSMSTIRWKKRSQCVWMQSIWCTTALWPRIGHGSTKSKLTPHMQRIIPLFSMSRWLTVLCRSLPANRKS